MTSIGDRAFLGCSGLTNLNIPDSVTSIGKYAFDGCDKLFRTSKGIRYIDKWAIGVVNNSLATAEVADGTKGIADFTFNECRGLTNAIIPDSVKTIGNDAFRWCFSLKNIVIGSNVEFIGAKAFSSCESLSSAEFRNVEKWYKEDLDSGMKSDISSETLLDKAEAAFILKNLYNSLLKKWKI